MIFEAIVPMLQTESIARTRAWYEATLGFTCVSPEDDRWCRLVRDKVTIMFMKNDHLGSPQATATQYMYVVDVMALFKVLKAECVIEWGPSVTSYGMMEFAIRDPNGYLLSFGEKAART
jgi:uncharacterized glyoxalase superfamily protein PhnB